MFKKMKLGAKLRLGFGVVLAALVVVGGVGYLKIDSVHNAVLDLSGTHVPLLKTIDTIDSAVGDQELAITKYALHKETEYRTKFKDMAKEVDSALATAKKITNADPDLVKKGWPRLVDAIAAEHDQFMKAGQDLGDAIAKQQPAKVIASLADNVSARSQAVMKKIDALVAANDKEASRVSDEADTAANSAQALIGAIGAAALVIGVLLALFITRSITKPIHAAIAGLAEGSQQVASAANQVSTSGQQLAQGAAEQAASLEETSSSLEEMASMTKTNAGNANQANSLMDEAKSLVDRANQAMGELTTAIDDINKAGEETGKIIKTIDEIAFQTNLLALNAAVEAARAGEAGAGFAVVADEVRNLAMRAADAAKNTAGLIEGSIKKTKEGSNLVGKTSEAFHEVAGASAKVAELVGEIAAASDEQAQGIEQVNRATNEMDKVTQQNAANAEESAAAAEELSAQAVTMSNFVDDLIQLVGTSNGSGQQYGQKRRGKQRKNAERRALPSPAVRPQPSKAPKKADIVLDPHHAEADASDDEDFKEF